MQRVYEIITNRVIELLEQGTVPWRRPWGGPDGAPRNLNSGKAYRGVNVFVLSAAGYESPYWVSFKQARQRGGHVRKGEKGMPCVFWNWLEKEDRDSGKEVKIPFLRYYTVFNVEQCDNVDYPKAVPVSPTFEPIEACEAIVSGMPARPPIKHGGARACYRPTTDQVCMPEPTLFEPREAYYATLFHELVHSTGHQRRLARKEIMEPIRFGSSPYSREELIAEMGGTYLCGHAGIEGKVIENSAAYIDHWLKTLRGDTRMVVSAGSQAQKAADYILTRHKEPSSTTVADIS